LDIGSILLILSITILVGFFVSRPFFSDFQLSESEKPLDDEIRNIEHELSNLMAEKDRLFIALQELDSDYSLGKIPNEEYAPQRTEYKNTAARVLRRIDEMDVKIQALEGGHSKPLNPSPAEPVTDEKMDEIEEIITARRRARNEKSAGFCPHCGKVIQKSDLFCPSCGSKVAA
jgi:hypothetical protein